MKHNLFLVIVAPTSGRMFGWWRCFHATASLQNLCTLPCQHKSQKVFTRPDAYAEGVFKFVRKVEAGDFNGNISALELALVY